MAASNRQLDEARRLLDVGRDADAESLRRAFKAAVKAAHPDRPGGNDERLRRVIEAYRRLDARRPGDRRRTRANRRGSTSPPAQAVLGGWAHLTLDDGRALTVRLPAGLRQNELVRVSGRGFRIAIERAPAAAIVGNNVVITARVARALLADGGRLTIDTPAGETSVWITKADAARGFVRVCAAWACPRAGATAGRRPGAAAEARARRAPTAPPPRPSAPRFAAAWAA